MALKKCKECTGVVSTDAKTCPHCGTGQGISAGKLLLIGILCLPVFIAVVESNSENIAISAVPAPPLSEEGIAAQKAAMEAEQKRYVQAAIAAKAVRSSMREPESLSFGSIRANSDASLVCVEYRAKNGFGGMNKDFAIYQNGNPSQNPEVWNKRCTQPLFDLIQARHAI